jgi:hypothetical protein
MTVLYELIASAPSVGTEKPVQLRDLEPAMAAAGVSPSDALAVSWCRFSMHNIEALTEGTTLAIIHPLGIVETTGKKKMLGGGYKFRTIDFRQCRGFGPEDHINEQHGIAKFCIELVGAGGILLGRLEWHAQGKRFREDRNRQEAMKTAEERDRILSVVESLLGQS